MKKYTKDDFIYEEDFVIDAECAKCGNIVYDEDDIDEGVCPDCGGNLLNNTSHEDGECAICGGHIDMWEDVYRHCKTDTMICCECYDKLPNSNNCCIVTPEWIFHSKI